MIIPLEKLDPNTLHNMLDAFITREGTDYGLEEQSLDTKREQLHQQLTRGELFVSFDTETESFTLVTKEQLSRQR